ncbi:DUF2304 domain-containing protein [Microbacterium sp. NPDC057407]|uniref:DUF2304 domain-containing protein n=1 Tax=Microbacterium sp. NPDC057407 TaxID=3346120 RepID=UPI00366F5FBC
MIVLAGITLAAIIIALVLWLLLTRRLREKYAALWLIIGLGVLVLGAVPQLLLTLTSALGVQVPANLLFSIAIVLLLGVSLHLSWELSQAEDEIRRVAEEAAISRAEIERLSARLDRLETASGDEPGDRRSTSSAGTD